ncbi:polyprenyl synthetase family protein [Myxococcota bacterium]|nr:polyprenyl synthetase family protein [Myxococcota bacterium]
MFDERISQALAASLAGAEATIPPRLRAAMASAVWGGGGRLRPKLCLAVAAIGGDPHPALTDAAAVAVELIHCASLVHDDLPCFDDADWRRGRPSIHRAYDEATAVLVGDALIIAAFEVIAEAASVDPARGLRMLRALSRASGHRGGLVAGQAWESEPAPDLARYHQAKTGGLFAAAAALGAISADLDEAHYAALGAELGAAYQIADDLSDALADPDALGKPVGQDAALDRPSALRQLGLEGAKAALCARRDAAMALTPSDPTARPLRALIERAISRLLPPVELAIAG